ncbi:Glycosyltransferase involved in cell wall bisynthesis [Polynucleobacter meluiroseus]|uniref:Glycosyltransferase involved in cell wall bisynthesis n=1 Tax=Polynucleobacter meluiroseus TaxID=1938814 RepID=A0A240E2F0_9BURK|nr:glycosyltransferase family 1 protein [Polynucleobacter meluiroseus]SNX29605.1 Glycosyltransferase involved in cell wall bisynthesis [Polynucleobacter meluiroseus]
MDDYRILNIINFNFLGIIHKYNFFAEGGGILVTIDTRWINKSGIGTYLINILPGVIAANPQIEFCLLGEEAILRNSIFSTFNNVYFINFSSIMYSLSEQWVIIRKIPKKTTLFWATHYNIPLLYRGAMLVTVYDLFHLAKPHLVRGFHKRLYAKLMFWSLHYRAVAILTISHFSKCELIRFAGKFKQPIFPIHLGVADDWFEIPQQPRPYLRKYVLFVGNVKPHKNLSALVEAFGSISHLIQHDLIIVGKKEGFITGDSAVADAAIKLGDRVHFTGYVDAEVLHQYFAHAELMVFPSLYEGFGLPPLEAMAAGCPVLCSNSASLPEVCGDAAIYFDPNRVSDIAEKMLALVDDDILLASLKRKGLEHAKSFSWKSCVSQTCEVIQGLLNNSSKGMK